MGPYIAAPQILPSTALRFSHLMLFHTLAIRTGSEDNSYKHRQVEKQVHSRGFFQPGSLVSQCVLCLGTFVVTTLEGGDGLFSLQPGVWTWNGGHLIMTSH